MIKIRSIVLSCVLLSSSICAMLYDEWGDAEIRKRNIRQYSSHQEELVEMATKDRREQKQKTGCQRTCLTILRLLAESYEHSSPPGLLFQ